MPGAVIDYYETVERTMGGRAQTQEFARCFLVPGMNRCTGGDGAFAIDYLTYLEEWVERGHAPEALIGAHVLGISYFDAFKLRFPLAADTPISFTRPTYPYPLLARYKGRGDPHRAESFEPIEVGTHTSP